MNVTTQPVPGGEPAAEGGGTQNRLIVDFSEKDPPVPLAGFSGAEAIGRWTNGPSAQMVLPLPPGSQPVLLLGFDLRAFIEPERLPCQRATVSVNGTEMADWVITETIFRRRVLAIRRAAVAAAGSITLRFELPDCAQPVALGFKHDARFLGLLIRRVTVEGAAEIPPPDALFWQYGRPVGGEAAKSFDRRIENGFWQRFVTGPSVLDVGFRGYGGSVLPILEGAIGVDLDYPGYDGHRLPFEDGSQDAVFSSHCLEHIPGYVQTIQDWYRVTRLGGHIIAIVPSAALYERKRRPPSRWNDDHKRFYTPASLLSEFDQALAPNSFRVRYLEENDEGYFYENGPDVHPNGCYEIVLVIQKIERPKWDLEG